MRYAAVAVAAGVLAAGACTREEATVLAPVVRFVDGVAPTGSEARPGTASAPRRGSMGEQHRYVIPLRQDGFQSTFESQDVAVPKDGRLLFGLGASFGGSGGDRAVTFEVRSCIAAACETLFRERVDFATQGEPVWLERSIALERLAGQSRRFVFYALTTSPAARALFGNPTILAPTPRAAEDHNIILISLDTLRADRLESYGYRHPTAPFIDETFARGGTIFEHCVAAATNTSPSHMTMFTSLPPSVHGVGLLNTNTLAPWISTLPELLRAERFTTGAITENGWVVFSLGFGRGFDTYSENKGPNIMKPTGQVDVTMNKAAAWLREHKDERFFLFLHTYQVHFPYAPPAQYASLFADQASVPAPARDESANYDREIRFTDDMLRNLMVVIRELGLGDKTIVVLTSDHGDEFLEHDCSYHGPHLYEEVTRVPLMLWGPGVRPGVRVAEPVGLIDVMPTILDLAGAAVPRHALGKSLLGSVRTGHAEDGRTLSTEAWAVSVCEGRKYEAPGVAIRRGRWKLARYRRDGALAYELFDLAADPGERSNRYGTGMAAEAPLQALLDAYEADSLARATALRSDAGATAEPAAAPIDDRQREKLRALGYTD